MDRYFISIPEVEAQAIAWFLTDKQPASGSFSLAVDIDDDSIAISIDGNDLETITSKFVWEFPEKFGAAGFDDTADEEGETADA